MWSSAAAVHRGVLFAVVIEDKSQIYREDGRLNLLALVDRSGDSTPAVSGLIACQ